VRDAAEQFARSLAGDDEAAFVRLFQGALNLADGASARPRRGARSAARLRTVGLPAASATSIYTDEVYVRNARTMIRDRTRVIGGVETPDFPDCVAIGAADRWCCSGTLVAPNVVVTAGHCVARDCGSRVFIGPDTDRPEVGRTVAVAQSFVNSGYRPPQVESNDIAILVLAEDVTSVPTRRIAGPEALATAKTVRLAGYGCTDTAATTGYGRRRMVEVPLAAADIVYGADPQVEFVAGAPFLDRDSCNGDSGGPAYVEVDGEWRLAGATSRATASVHRPCGDGGIYTRVASYEQWIRSLPGGHW
jgi:secreted trypsin-like serine protease